MLNRNYLIGQTVQVMKYENTVKTSGRKSQYNIGDEFIIHEIRDEVLIDNDYNFVHMDDVKVLIEKNTDIQNEFFDLIVNTGLEFIISSHKCQYGTTTFLGKNIKITKEGKNTYSFNAQDTFQRDGVNVQMNGTTKTLSDTYTKDDLYKDILFYEDQVIQTHIINLLNRAKEYKAEKAKLGNIKYVYAIKNLMGWNYEYMPSGIGYGGGQNQIVFCDDKFKNPIVIKITDLISVNNNMEKVVKKFGLSDDIEFIFCDKDYYIDNVL